MLVTRRNGNILGLKHQNFGRFAGGSPKSLDQYIGDREPVPASIIPREYEIDGMTKMPGIFRESDGGHGGIMFVSQRFRAILEELAPGQVEYINVKMEINPNQQPDSAYYFINILPHAQTIDWTQSEKNAGPSRWRIRRRHDGDPSIWWEKGVAPVLFSFFQDMPFITDPLWERMNKEFSGDISTGHYVDEV